MSSTQPTAETPAAPADPMAALAEPSVLDGAKAADAPAAGAPSPGAEGEAEPKTGEGDKATPEGMQAGAPEAYDLKMPEGVTLNEDAWKAAEPAFREANLSQEQAQKLAEAFPQIAEGIAKQQQTATISEVAAIRKEWAEQWNADPEIGGANKEKALTVIAAARDSLTKDEQQFFTDTGLGNNKIIGKLLYRLGLTMQEGALHQPSPPQAPASTPESRRYGKAFQPAAG